MLDVGDGAAAADEVAPAAGGSERVGRRFGGSLGIDENERIVSRRCQVGPRRRPADGQDRSRVGGQGAQELVLGPHLHVVGEC